MFLLGGLCLGAIFTERGSEYALISKEYLAQRSQPAMKRPRSFYVKSSGNQRMRLGPSPPMKTRYHQINPVDSIKNALPVFSCQTYTDYFFHLIFNKLSHLEK